MSFKEENNGRLLSRVTSKIPSLVLTALAVAVALTQSSNYVHAQASIKGTWSYQKEAEPKQLGATSFNGVPYSPFQIRIDSLEAHGQLIVEEKEDLFLLSKEDGLILVIPKEVSGRTRLQIRHREEYGGPYAVQNTIELKSNNPDVLLCAFIKKLHEYHRECLTEVTTNQAIIEVTPQKNLEELAKSAGVLSQEVAATLFSFDLDGKIDGQRFLMKGRGVYDNTEQSKLAFYEKARDRVRSQFGVSKKQLLLAALIAAAIIAAQVSLILLLDRGER